MTEIEYYTSVPVNGLKKIDYKQELQKVEILENKLIEMKKIEDEVKKGKEKLYELMDAVGLKSFHTDKIIINKIAPGKRISVDSAKLKKEQPEIYEKYTKTSNIKGYVKILKQENKRMLAQVENILQISRLEKGNLHLEREPLDVHELISNAIGHLQVMLDERGGVLRTHFLAENGDVSANKSHLTNVFVNVIENAIKYSPNAPEIDIYTENIKNKILIRVKDRGQGMSRQAMKHVFTKFYREHTGDLHNVKGHGLGLAYVKSIVEYHQGSIDVESDKGKGSTFFIKLPVI